MMKVRPRRLRQNILFRQMVAETHVHAHDLMFPYFIVDGQNQRQAIASMPGIERVSIDNLLIDIERDMAIGVNKVLLFGVPDNVSKDARGGSASDENNLISRAIRAVRRVFGAHLLVATDVCLCAYTDHGHCGILQENHVLNDASLPYLSAMALRHAESGADMVAPSDMMDGRISHMRDTLDQAGFSQCGIMSYAVKYASAYYGPFRDAAHSAPGQGDRKSYQMDPRNRREAWREAALDEAEGADILMVKPALAYLDIVADIAAKTTVPVACYNVSGEYALIKAAAAQGWIDEASLVRENFIAMKRAGASLLITYHARDALKNKWLD